MSERPTEQRPTGGIKRPGLPGSGARPWPSWLPWVVVLLIIAVVVLPGLTEKKEPERLSFGEFRARVEGNTVTEVDINTDTGDIRGELRDGTSFESTGPKELPPSVQDQLKANGVADTYHTTRSSLWGQLFVYLIPFGLLMLFFLWMSRRAQGQMGGIMSIGKSRAKVFTTEKPRTTFADVAGYEGVKLEIKEVVDFLKQPAKFKEIGARIPKGVLLVGPPGTGKTLIARAVAGEAGVPFMSVTGSDFMEMFVGVGASRVRDLFQNAKKQAPCIIFVDEIDSIGRKRGAGLGGGHDEREQTLNQMLSEMDGFETTEGVVMLAATNRPDILDPALLRPGRFDRQVVVPLPDLEERLPILRVHSKDKRLATDVDLSIVARGTPGMSGADLANLVNEAALFAVRRGADQIHMIDFESARDRVLMGQRRESTVLSEKEKESTAYHEGGHAVLAYVMEHADPVHKVTILPTGMALGATQQLPMEERHTYWREYIEDMLVVTLGGRCAELLVYGTLTTGASDDLERATELARKMVRQWGMSDEIGPMAWGSAGMVFLGEDLMHSRDYSEDTARVVDEEVKRILGEQEVRAMAALREHRKGLDLVAKALLEKETVDGAEVGRLVDKAAGRKISDKQTLPERIEEAMVAEPSNGDNDTGSLGEENDDDTVGVARVPAIDPDATVELPRR